MPNILVRDVAPDIHSTLVERAARQGRSLQQYLSEELARLARHPSREEVLERIERRRGIDLDMTTMLDGLRADREGR